MYPTFNINTLKMIYFAYFHSVMQFGISFWGVSTDSKKVFFLQQKRVVRIMTGPPPGLQADHCSVNWKYWLWFLNIYCLQWDSYHLIWKVLHLIPQYIA
jgi:hypothetical protein